MSQGRRLAVYKKILQDNVKKWMIKEYLEYRLARLGYVDSEILKTPLGTRIVIYAERPSRIIGKKGAVVKELSQILGAKLGVDNPQIDVIDIAKVEAPEMFPKVVAYRIANAMAKGIRFRRVAFVAIRQVMEAGAKGMELVISGKLSTERAKFEKYKVGKIYKTGYDAKNTIRRAVVHVLLNPGIYGVEVSIAPASARFADEFKLTPPQRAEAQPTAQ
ncbi:MAG: 30S ribosomal protein S3 [Thermoproteus sp. AZ2]|uniref:30S ribosomal protein S3 n=1 Tax=Thermoproteus sp. AZ2 TaxID=1609232 RepID=A0ACC6V1B3_9CREN|nr:MAG: 30S ribosomal protein S3 [Thermoproteus sp. AZ2]